MKEEFKYYSVCMLDNGKQITFVQESIPLYAKRVADVLIENGFESYLVGGSVRDLMLHRVPADFDIATNCLPDKIQELFPKSVSTGARFGTITVVMEDEFGENHNVEVTTYRSESEYYKGRWPGKVEFSKSIEKDLERRDFTINAFALDMAKLGRPDVIVEELVMDLFGGLADLTNRTIRAVGDPNERFSEDALRMLRACRLASQLSFSLDENTKEAIKINVDLVKQVSIERIRDEFLKMLYKSPRPSVGIEMLRETGLLGVFLPELLECVGVTQPEYHVDDVYTHSLKVVDLALDEVKVAGLLHDIGKARTISKDSKGTHFYQHDELGAKMAENIMKRLKFPTREIEKNLLLIRNHMFYYPSADWRKTNIQLKSDTLRLVVMRHAETDYNLRQKLVGSLDVELSDNGRKQASKAAENLSELGVDFIIASPLKRALETAQIINNKLNIEIVVDDRFRERNFGILEGLSWQEFANKYPDIAAHPGNSEKRQEYLPEGESITEVNQRVKLGLASLYKKYAGKSILLVTHQGIIRLIRRLVSEETEAETLKSEFENSEYKEILIKEDSLDQNILSDIELQQLEKEDNVGKLVGGWSDAAIRRFILKIGGMDNFNDLIKLRLADATANPKTTFSSLEVQALQGRVSRLLEQDSILKTTDLKINGTDLIKLGVDPGPEIGRVLKLLLDEVLDDPALNDAEILSKIVISKYLKK